MSEEKTREEAKEEAISIITDAINALKEKNIHLVMAWCDNDTPDIHTVEIGHPTIISGLIVKILMVRIRSESPPVIHGSLNG